MDEVKKDNHWFEISFQFDGDDNEAASLLEIIGGTIRMNKGFGVMAEHKKNPNYDSFGQVWE